jgi:UDP-N-acetylglucosamine transferase subunit ALG13
MVLKMLSQLPKFIKAIEAEHAAIHKIIGKENIDVLISDNRYGCYSRKVKSIFVTHQLNILMPPKWKWIEKFVNRFNHNQIRKFSECWIPAPDSSVIPSLLTSSETIEKKYIGYLSRMNLKAANIKYDVIAIMSGPPPQRQKLTEKIREQFKLSELKTLLVEGTVIGDSKVSGNRIHAEANFLLSTELNAAINQSSLVIARSGYSMVMDLAKLDKRAIFIPTPGQTEQEYIAQQLMKNKIAFSTSQSKFNLEEAIKEADKFSGFVNFGYDESLLDQAIDSVL